MFHCVKYIFEQIFFFLSRPVLVSIQEMLPMEGVIALLDNDIAERLVVPDLIVDDATLRKDPVGEMGGKCRSMFPL